jgi:hypothetical protein
MVLMADQVLADKAVMEVHILLDLVVLVFKHLVLITAAEEAETAFLMQLAEAAQAVAAQVMVVMVE